MEDETTNQRQARLRRERREAKIKAEGSSRLEKITNAAGRQNLADSFSSDSIHQAGSLAEKNARSQESRPPADSATVQGFSEGSQGPNEAQLRAFFESSPSLQGEPGNGVEQDPMMQMLQGFLGAAQSNIGAANSPPLGLSPNLAAMMGNPNGAAAPASIQHPETTTTESLTWKIIHAATAFSLGLYVIASSNTLGKSLIRIKGRSHDDELRTKDGTNLFWAFATVELILQSTRYFLQKGRTSSGFGGVMTTVIAFLPEPWAGYLRLAAQYSGIWTTTVEDACVLIFVIGMFSWWKDTAS